MIQSRWPDVYAEMNENKPAIDLSKPQYFYLIGNLWRSALYATLSIYLLALPSAYFSIVIMQQRSLADFSVGAVGLSMLGVWCAQFLLPRYRLDERGVSQRNFLPIWNLWTWDEFASQKVSFHFNRYTNSARQNLVLMLNDCDSELVKSIIQRICHPQPPSILPPTIRINKWTIFCRAIELTPHELVIEKKSLTERYAWHEIRRIECWTRDDSEGFLKIRFVLPDMILTYVNASQKEQPNLPCSQDIEITRFMKAKQIPFILIDQSRPPKSRAEYVARFEEANHRWRVTQKGSFILSLFFLCLGGLLFISMPFDYAIGMGLTYYPFVFWTIFSVRYDIHLQKKEFLSYDEMLKPN